MYVLLSLDDKEKDVHIGLHVQVYCLFRARRAFTISLTYASLTSVWFSTVKI